MHASIITIANVVQTHASRAATTLRSGGNRKNTAKNKNRNKAQDNNQGEWKQIREYAPSTESLETRLTGRFYKTGTGQTRSSCGMDSLVANH